MSTMHSPRIIRRNWLSGASNGAMFIFGIVMALLGSILPLVAERIRFDLAQAGNLFLSMNFAMLLSMLGLGLLMDRFGKKLILVLGSLTVAVALLLVLRASSYAALSVAVFLLGIGGGALNGAANTLVADLHGDPRQKGSALNLLGVYFGFGALFLPFVIGSVLKALGLVPILFLAAGLSLIPGALFLLQTFPDPKTREGLPFKQAGKMIKNPLVLLLGFLLFFESGNEFIMGGYTSTYLKTALGSSISTASYLLAVYWAAIMVGRVISSRLLLHVKGSTVILVSALGSALGGGILLTATSSSLATVGIMLIGLSFASIFPTVLGMAGSSFEQCSGTVFGILFGIALTGGMSLPWAVGHLSEAHGLRTGLTLVIINALMIFFLQTIVRRTHRRNETER